MGFFFTISNLVVKIKFWNIIFNEEKGINFQLGCTYCTFLKFHLSFGNGHQERKLEFSVSFPSVFCCYFPEDYVEGAGEEAMTRGRREEEEISFIPDL